MQLRRSLGLTDVTLFFVVTCTNLQWVAAAAAAGPGSLSLWLLGGVAMFAPLSIAVMHFSKHYPDEGGMYMWTKRAFGPFAGFLTGWTYWTTNLPYFPALLYFTAGNALFIEGRTPHGLTDSPPYFITFSLVAFAFGTLINIFGLDIGKWLTNIGGAARWAVTLLLIGFAGVALIKFGTQTAIDVQTVKPAFDFKTLIFWSVIAFAWTGPECAPLMAGEIRNPRRALPLGLALAAPVIAAIYIAGTASVLITVPFANVSDLYGVMQAVSISAARLNVQFITPFAAGLVTASCLGSVGAWAGAAARLPFVAGIDKYLPESFGRMHPRLNAPLNALLVQFVIASIFVFLGQGGTTVKGAYDVLVSTTVLTTLIPFLLLFAAAIKLNAGSRLVAIAAIVGLCTTTAALVLSTIPSGNEPNKVLAVVKIIGLSGLLVGSGVAIYAASLRRAARRDETTARKRTECA